MRRLLGGILAAGVALVVVACGTSGGDPDGSSAEAEPEPQSPSVYEPEVRSGAERIKYRLGPIAIQPGQNNIVFTNNEVPKPEFDGYITRIDADLEREDGSVPPVDVIHLHHGVWINASNRDAPQPQFFAAGEEKTVFNIPESYGYEYRASDRWIINYMLHNLFPTTDEVWITYELDIVPMDAPEASAIEPVRPIWMDVEDNRIYPVFDVIKGSGEGGLFTYPDDVPDAYGDGPARNEWVVDREGVLVNTAGHLHPGGLATDLWIEREGVVPTAAAAANANGPRARVFSSEAWYWEPAGAVSWDVAMTSTPDDWRVAVKPGDTLSISATYDTTRGSWYESMGIMVLWMADDPAGADPFTEDVAVPGVLTHGHLAENDNHGGEETTLPDARELDTRPVDGPIDIADFIYEAGDTSEDGEWIPSVGQGESLTFNNVDAPVGPAGIWHTITACKAPCNRRTGIAYPVADGDIQFDSGQLGIAGEPTAGRVTWETPPDLPTGTYTYFCRVHPFMRGAFEVTAAG